MGEERTRRHFDSGRLYRLSRVAILVLTGLAIVWAHGLYTTYIANTDVYANLQGGCERYYPTHGFDSSARDLYDECLAIATDVQTNGENKFALAVTIAIGLPLLFSGGTAVYKYLFPVKHAD
jgi:hypothetical protein